MQVNLLATLFSLTLFSCHSNSSQSSIQAEISNPKSLLATKNASSSPVASSNNGVFSPFTLLPGQYVVTGILTLIFQTDGNLVLYKNFATPTQSALWSSGTQLQIPQTQCQAIFQSDGNFVIYQNSKAVWSTGTQALQPELYLTAFAPYVSIWNGTTAASPVQASTTGNFNPFVIQTNQYVRTGTLTLFMQTDGNLVLYENFGQPNSVALWASNTSEAFCMIGCQAQFLSNGNLVLYHNGVSYWSMGTQASPPILEVQPVSPFVSVGTGLDDTQIIQNAIDEAVSTGTNATVTLEPRVYNLTCPNSLQTYCLNIPASNFLTIKGTPGQTKLLVNSFRSGVIHAVGANNLTLNGFSIDYQVAPYSQGTITAVTPQYLQYTVTSGYPYPNDPLFTDDVFGVPGSERLGMIFSPGSKILKNIPTSSRGTVSMAKPAIALGNNSWQMWTAEQGINQYINVGDSFVFVPRTSYALFFQSCANLTLSQINLYTSPFMGAVVGGSTGTVTFNNYNVMIPPGSNRLLSTVADAIHAQDNSAKFIIENSQIGNIGDDLLNICATTRQVYAVNGNQLQLYRPSSVLLEYAVGDQIQVVDPTLTIARLGSGGAATITSVGVSADQKWVYLGLNENIQNLPNGQPATQANDYVFDIQQGSPASVLHNNKFGTARGIVRFRSPNATVEDYNFSDPISAQILFSTDAPWLEGPMSGPPINISNVVMGGVLEFLGVGLTPVNDP